ncbi:Bug family tripartite tricarboxylate transporter substrate binding protein [Pseudochelatococcus sp. B33]
MKLSYEFNRLRASISGAVTRGEQLRSFRALAAVIAVVGLPAIVLATPAIAQDEWPTRPVEVIVPWASGGGSDALARVIFEPLARRLGEAFPLDFRPGAAGIVGTAVVARNSAPDGYSLLFTSGPPIVAANFAASTPYKPQEDLLPILETAYGSNVLVANAAAPFNTFQEFIDYAKAHPGEVRVAGGGVGSNAHYLNAAIQFKAGVQFNFVPYNGVADQLADLMSGAVDVGLGNSSGYLPGIDAGKLKFIAAMAPERNPTLPDVPSSDESDYQGIYKTNWYGIFAPKGMPPELVEKINAEVRKTLLDPAVQANIEAQGFVVVTSGTPEDFAAMIEAEVRDTRELIDAGALEIGE